MDLGADLCCDSAHKTLPVLTGGAYLHVSERLLEATGNGGRMGSGAQCAPRDALSLFGSTSPSYLILQSLDLANPWLETLPEKLAAFLPKLEALKARLTAAGWTLTGDEPLKLTLSLVGAATGRPPEANASGIALASALEKEGIFCEFADPAHVVFMLSPNNTDGELARLEAALRNAKCKMQNAECGGRHRKFDVGTSIACPRTGNARPYIQTDTVCSLREAMLSPAVRIPAAESLGRILARPGVSCPPAVPILMPGERIDEAAVEAFEKYGIQEVSVLP
jgi:arginine/lysine/ornithine decarboxylase